MSKGARLTPGALALEPTFSPAEIGAHLGLGSTQVAELVALGKEHGARLHPAKGGLWPTFRGAKHRRIPLSALNRHKRHLARLAGEAEPPPTMLVQVALVAVEGAA